jgi:nicotinate-nucleotide adenylyltransferase
MKRKKIILFGGTFDPIHLGHTKVAAAAVKYIEADRMIFVPAKRSPLKGYLPNASDIDRLMMINIAISKQDIFEVSDWELNMSAPSYTLNTVRHFREEYGSDTALYWLVGADSIDDLIYWYGITELIDECNIAMMYRADFDKPDFAKFEQLWGKDRIEKLQKNIIPTPLINISSTEVRKRLNSGHDVTQLLDPAVLSYIREHNLYGYKPNMLNQ